MNAVRHATAVDAAARGRGAGLVLPRRNIATMTLHLAEMATAVAPGAHALPLVDRAGWHLSDRLVVPATSSNHAMAWRGLRLAGIAGARPEFGKPFTLAA